MNAFFRPLPARDPHEKHRAATPLEIFFDLVSVIAIAAVTEALHHAVSEGHGLELLVNFAYLFVAIWWAWMNYTWFASAFNNDDRMCRILTMVIMSGALVFAAGASSIFETLDFKYGIAGWAIMRIGMIGLWLRAAMAGPQHRPTALRYAGGIAFAQALWTLVYFSTVPGSPAFLALSVCVFLFEFAVPLFAERAGMTPWHRHHIIERYGLLNMIVLGEVLLSISLILGKLYGGHADPVLIATAVSGMVAVFVLWWLYFLDADHLGVSEYGRAFVWGYGHIVIFAAGALLAAGFGAYMDVVTHHSKITAGDAAAWINLSMAAYLLGLWLVRDRYLEIGWRRHLLFAATLAFGGLAVLGAAPWFTAALVVAVIVARA